MVLFTSKILILHLFVEKKEIKISTIFVTVITYEQGFGKMSYTLYYSNGFRQLILSKGVSGDFKAWKANPDFWYPDQNKSSHISWNLAHDRMWNQASEGFEELRDHFLVQIEYSRNLNEQETK